MNSDFSERQYMVLALAEAARAATEGEVPVGAVIVKEGNVIAAAHNRRENDRSATAHAELLAIEAACRALHTWRLTGCTLYVTLEPCPMCGGAVVNARLDRVVYGAKDARSGAMGSVLQLLSYPLNHKPALTGGVMAKESAELLATFFENKRKNPSVSD